MQEKLGSRRLNKIFKEDEDKLLDEEDDFDQFSTASEGSDEAIETERSPCILSPDNPARIIWDLSMFLFIVYQAVTLPARIAFEFKQTDVMFHFEFTVDICFMVDILFNFNTGILSKGLILMSRKLIAIEYLSFWFWLDVISSTPYTWIFAYA